ncbi:hypothetical protein C9374_003316 [Naegleria lovaniensis]|uniref:UDP-N-acetylglucosamine diphosphorylase n=1 Tax=Naegleria lovaniensis TaxID=51637 RepID=A0AA88GNQ8_NAELO|nr:uncharacterized protein C9374_003316 [Naegleria lovaniensis]KAG2385501.1 hypothetical protein C9374_003316 [Naegleria lovaniensis]
MAQHQTTRDLFVRNGQEHVFAFEKELSEEQLAQLYQQLAELPSPELLNGMFQESVVLSGSPSRPSDVIAPPPNQVISFNRSSTEEEELKQIGMDAIQRGELGVLLLSGGQGTRLGSLLPKGMYDVGLQSGKTLFHIQAERILRLQQLAGTVHPIPWYIMTSNFTHEETEQYFRDNSYFGLKKEQILFFQQGDVPCFSMDGKLLLQSKHEIATAPNGNGGVYQALAKFGILDHMKQRGIKFIHSYCVDNILVKIGDPIFIGHCIKHGCDFGTKVVPKRDPHEKVGVFALKNGKYHVVEYSEITKEMAERVDETTGQLCFNAGNIVNFFYTLEFLERCADILNTHKLYHIAKKDIESIDINTGEKKKQPGVKLELFNFDIVEYAKSVTIFQVDRESEFSPLKNAPNQNNSDSPETCRRDLSILHSKYLERAGANVVGDCRTQLCEISPLVTYAGENLESFKGKTIPLPCHITHTSN